MYWFVQSSFPIKYCVCVWRSFNLKRRAAFWMRPEDFKFCEIFLKSKNQCVGAQHLLCDHTFPVCITLVRGHDLIMWAEKDWVELLNHQFLSYWSQPHVPVVIFQFSKTIYPPKTPHWWLSVLIFYFRICSQKGYPGSPFTISIETKLLCELNDCLSRVSTLGFSKLVGGILVMKDSETGKQM